MPRFVYTLQTYQARTQPHVRIRISRGERSKGKYTGLLPKITQYRSFLLVLAANYGSIRAEHLKISMELFEKLLTLQEDKCLLVVPSILAASFVLYLNPTI